MLSVTSSKIFGDLKVTALLENRCVGRSTNAQRTNRRLMLISPRTESDCTETAVRGRIQAQNGARAQIIFENRSPPFQEQLLSTHAQTHTLTHTLSHTHTHTYTYTHTHTNTHTHTHTLTHTYTYTHTHTNTHTHTHTHIHTYTYTHTHTHTHTHTPHHNPCYKNTLRRLSSRALNNGEEAGSMRREGSPEALPVCVLWCVCK